MNWKEENIASKLPNDAERLNIEIKWEMEYKKYISLIQSIEHYIQNFRTYIKVNIKNVTKSSHVILNTADELLKLLSNFEKNLNDLEFPLEYHENPYIHTNLKKPNYNYVSRVFFQDHIQSLQELFQLLQKNIDRKLQEIFCIILKEKYKILLNACLKLYFIQVHEIEPIGIFEDYELSEFKLIMGNLEDEGNVISNLVQIPNTKLTRLIEILISSTKFLKNLLGIDDLALVPRFQNSKEFNELSNFEFIKFPLFKLNFEDLKKINERLNFEVKISDFSKIEIPDEELPQIGVLYRHKGKKLLAIQSNYNPKLINSEQERLGAEICIISNSSIHENNKDSY